MRVSTLPLSLCEEYQLPIRTFSLSFGRKSNVPNRTICHESVAQRHRMGLFRFSSKRFEFQPLDLAIFSSKKSVPNLCLRGLLQTLNAQVLVSFRCPQNQQHSPLQPLLSLKVTHRIVYFLTFINVPEFGISCSRLHRFNILFPAGNNYLMNIS